MKNFWLCFIPLFVSVDPLGAVPVFLGLTQHLKRDRVKTVILQSAGVALLVSLGFLFIGRRLLNVLSITIGDFMIAGGVLLFALAAGELVGYEKSAPSRPQEGVGAVPIGVPLLAGPAVFTAGLLLLDQYGPAAAFSALTANILLAGVVLWFASGFARLLGKTGTRVISKLASLLVAAFGVMMVRKGILLFSLLMVFSACSEDKAAGPAGTEVTTELGKRILGSWQCATLLYNDKVEFKKEGFFEGEKDGAAYEGRFTVTNDSTLTLYMDEKMHGETRVSIVTYIIVKAESAELILSANYINIIYSRL